MSLSSLRVNFCNYNTSLGQMCENGRLIPARIFLFLVHLYVWCLLLIRVALFALVKGYVSVAVVNLKKKRSTNQSLSFVLGEKLTCNISGKE